MTRPCSPPDPGHDERLMLSEVTGLRVHDVSSERAAEIRRLSHFRLRASAGSRPGPAEVPASRSAAGPRRPCATTHVDVRRASFETRVV